MKEKDILEFLAEDSHMSRYKLSLWMGKSSTYVNALLHQKSSPTLKTFIAFAEACGWNVFIEKDGQKIQITNEDSEET